MNVKFRNAAITLALLCLIGCAVFTNLYYDSFTGLSGVGYSVGVSFHPFIAGAFVLSGTLLYLHIKRNFNKK